MSVSAPLRQAFAPTGTLRASINMGNPILAKKKAETGQPFGVSIDLARALAQQLGVDVDLVVGNDSEYKVINWIDPHDKVPF